MHDAVIVGGSHGGLSTALVLARAGRSVLVVDSGSPRSGRSRVTHAFHTRDGEHGTAELLAIARRQLDRYPNVAIVDGEVTEARTSGTHFIVEADGKAMPARNVVLATGVRDVLPEIPGLDELWGTLAVRCPYCDGYELRNTELAVIGHDEETIGHLRFLRVWSRRLTLFTNGISIDGASQEDLRELGVEIEEGPIESIQRSTAGCAEIEVRRTRSTFQGIFLWPRLEFRNSLALALGCQVREGGSLIVNDSCETSIAGVYAVGDLIEPEMHMVALAVASGLKAAFAINASLHREAQA